MGSMSPMRSPHPLTPSPNFGRRGTGNLAPLSQAW
ncbi:MAG TPA: alpha/beta hydrolase, partial [Cyanobacteria bacterium UBA9273]|nr:alpha/beta hydrolase [Cyanobacteria bacterium UBA9273]